MGKHLLPYFRGWKLKDISTADCRNYAAARLDAGASAASINRELAIVKRAFSLAVQAGTLFTRPHIEMLDEDNVRSGFFEREQFDAVCRHLPAPLRPVATFAYFTGWRVPSEVLPLQWRNVDRVAKVIRLDAGTTKNRRARTLPYGRLPELVTLIDDQWTEHKQLTAAGNVICPYVFHRRGKVIRSFRGAWKTACTQAGAPGRVPHDLRRTSVRNLVRAGVPEKTAMQITGQKTRSVFDRYDIVVERDIEEGLGKLAAGTVAGTSGEKTGSGHGSA